mgnify:CR=1 FL=1
MTKELYRTNKGQYILGDVNEALNSKLLSKYHGKVNLILTSPPFPLVKKKEYGNLQGQEYVDWMTLTINNCLDFLSEDGSLVIEIGNAWEPGRPTISTVPMEALLNIKKETGLFLCQEIIVHNPARLPSPIEWVNKQRSRLKDSWTRVWWFSKTPTPKASNLDVLKEYSKSMKSVLDKKKYNSGIRPSGHKVGEKSFLKNHGGSISPSFLDFSQKYLFDVYNSSISLSNSGHQKDYQAHCDAFAIKRHPARMQSTLVDFFIHFLTEEDDLVMDIFAGSNTTGWRSEELNRKWIGIERDWEYGIGSVGRFDDLRKDFALNKYVK